MKMAQALARHSDIRLTLGVYTHVGLEDQTAAIGMLPGPPDGGIDAGGGSGSMIAPGNACGIPAGGESGFGGDTAVRGRLRENSITHWHSALMATTGTAVVPLAPRAATNLRAEIGQVHRRMGSIEEGKKVGVVSLWSEAGYD